MSITENTLKATAIVALLSGCAGDSGMNPALQIITGINITSLFIPDPTPPFRYLLRTYENKQQASPVFYQKLAKWTQIPSGICYDPYNNFFGATMQVTYKNKPDKYEINIKKHDSATVKYRGHMSHGDTYFVSDTYETMSLKLARKKDDYFIIGRIERKDTRKSNMCLFSIKAKRKK